MFTGIINDVGAVLEVSEQATGLRRLHIACSYDPETIDVGRLDCLLRHMPHSGSARAGKAAGPGLPSTPPRKLYG